jgi:hypothetical protein
MTINNWDVFQACAGTGGRGGVVAGVPGLGDADSFAAVWVAVTRYDLCFIVLAKPWCFLPTANQLEIYVSLHFIFEVNPFAQF